MSRYTEKQHTADVLAAAEHWKARCLQQQGSVFSEQSLWNADNIAQLVTHYANNLDAGDGSFTEKLSAQLADATPAAKQLAAEMLWLMLLGPSNVGPDAKRSLIAAVWQFAGSDLPSSDWLSDAALEGIGSGGMGYNTNRWREFLFFIHVMAAFFRLDDGQRKALLQDHQQFAQWLEKIEDAEVRQFRHMLLYLLFPDYFERIFSAADRKQVVTQLAGLSNREYQALTPFEVDQQLAAIRQQWQQQLESTGQDSTKLDFYLAPLRQRWKDTPNSAQGSEYVVNSDSTGNNEVSETTHQYQPVNTDVVAMNTILYGPPGTGKTYSTILRAVQAADPEFTAWEDRPRLKARYDELLTQGRIRFVTFHQSYSYEDFVEGIRAETEDGKIRYEVKPGVFIEACEAARAGSDDGLALLEHAIAQEKRKFFESERRLTLSTVRGLVFDIEFTDKRTFKVYPSSTENEDPKYVASLDNVRKLYVTGSKEGIYNHSYVTGFLNYLIAHYDLPEYKEAKPQHKDPYVLIIDEINRGNISKIFGELITLIEPSKREGQPEALSVTLPHSKEQFSVPSNLHIIGTMNTADRSLALIDTALRRRFDFIEMMPDYSLLAGKAVKGIELDRMLRAINQRIEYLYDREHSIGHAFLMPVVKRIDESQPEKAYTELVSVFIHKILPLLEEYFYEDWQRIRLVLGDNQKPLDYQFVTENAQQNADNLFGRNHNLQRYGDEQVSFQLNEALLRNGLSSGEVSGNEWPPEAFIAIYAPQSVSSMSGAVEP